MNFNFRTQWIKSLSNKWYKFEVPISLKLELIIISILSKSTSLQDVLSLIVSEVLSVPVEEIDEELNYQQLIRIVNLVVPKIPTSSNSDLDQLNNNTDELKELNMGSLSSISKMIAFLSYYGKIQPSEVLGLPRVMVVDIMKEISNMVSSDKKMEYELSVVSALSKIFGGGDKNNTSTESTKSITPNDGTIDLSTIDTNDLVNKLGVMESLTGVIKVEK